MADRRAMASGFSLSEMATDGGWLMKVAAGGGTTRGRSMGASCATVAVGVMGDTGGRSGETEPDRLREWSETVEALLDEAGRIEVSTRSAGMAAAR